MLTLQEIKERLRAGAYAWPGGYPLFFITTDGAALSFKAVRQEWRQIAYSHIHDIGDGWQLAAVDINYEDDNLYCDHTGEKIEAAYCD